MFFHTEIVFGGHTIETVILTFTNVKHHLHPVPHCSRDFCYVKKN